MPHGIWLSTRSPFRWWTSILPRINSCLCCGTLYAHPNGQIPAYEWNFSDVNPPVHAWATLFLYNIEKELGRTDLRFLERSFQGLMQNFNWWVNRKDPQGKNVFAGGFLGLDNIGVFDRSAPLPTGGHLDQADGTAWMAFYCQNMLEIALILAEHDSMYEDIAYPVSGTFPLDHLCHGSDWGAPRRNVGHPRTGSSTTCSICPMAMPCG